jgi:hypothetical protein
VAVTMVVVLGTNWTSERRLNERQKWNVKMNVKMSIFAKWGGYHHFAKMFIFVDILMLILDFIFKKGIKMKSENEPKMNEKCLL